MKNKIISLLCMAVLSAALVTGCGAKDSGDTADQREDVTSGEEQEPALEEGVYSADFDTDSSMFHVSEACDGKGTLTVKDGEMTIHISLASKKVINLYPGLAEDAQKDGAQLLEPTTDTVTYSDGITEEVYGFDVPVPALDEEFDLALIGTKGTWYDHKVSVSNPVPIEEDTETAVSNEPVSVDMEDGEYEVDVTLEGGSGKATVSSPAVLIVKDKKAYARIEWSSPNYDYMKIGDTRYDPVNTDGNSVFEIPVTVFDEKMTVIADTVAMSTPHEIEYTLLFHMDEN